MALAFRRNCSNPRMLFVPSSLRGGLTDLSSSVAAKSSVSNASICTTRRRIPARASTDQGAGKGDFIRTSTCDKYSNPMKITTHLDYMSRWKAASGTNRSNRWTYRVFIINTRCDYIWFDKQGWWQVLRKDDQIVFFNCLDFTASRRISASASTNQGPGKGDLVSHGRLVTGAAQGRAQGAGLLPGHTPYTFNPDPYTLHRQPYILHPTP